LFTETIKSVGLSIAAYRAAAASPTQSVLDRLEHPHLVDNRAALDANHVC
jgi:hypothetical protein